MCCFGLGVYDRLSKRETYTGMYARRFDDLAELTFAAGAGGAPKASPGRAVSSFQGHTNTRSDETIKDISTIMRPNLRQERGSMKF